jgi:DNA-binding CsgD family transcriptional regulator
MNSSMSQQVKVRRMLEWLTFMPPLDKVARTLVLDYFLSYGPIESAIWHLNSRDALTCLAVYGPSDAIVGVPMPADIWRNSSEVQLLAAQASSKKDASWSECGCDTVVNLYSQSMHIGFLTLRFPEAIDNPERLGSEIEEISMLISLYLALKFWESVNHNGSAANSRVPYSRNGKPDLTERQRVVLAGIVMKKTNNAIANELGYSVSTIRHETMRIFEILGVSNRVEAASYATTLGLI